MSENIVHVTDASTLKMLDHNYYTRECPPARPVAFHTKVPLHTVLYRCLGDSFIVQAFMGGIMI